MRHGPSAPARDLELEPVRARRHWRRPTAYGLLALAVVLALISGLLAIRLGYRLADAERDADAFAARDPIIVLILGAGALGLFRLAERLGDF